MANRRPVVLRTDTTPARLQELPAGDLLDAETLTNALQVVLTGLVVTNGAPVTAADTLLVAIGKLTTQNSTYTTVPTANRGPVILVTSPHNRHMVWNGSKYVRAPWHMPGVLFHSTSPAASVTHGIQVRADVTYNKADHPDLAEILGVAGTTFILPEGRARVLRAADNGRGIDAALVNGYLQEDAIRNITGQAGAVLNSGIEGAFSVGSSPSWQVMTGSGLPAAYAKLDASTQVPTASENRVKSLAATLYITR